MTVLCPPTPAAREPLPSFDIHSAQVNLSGRRRFTSQRVVLFAVLASLGHEGATETARQSLAQLQEAHTTLLQGRGALPGVSAGPLHDAYFGTLQADAEVTAFIVLAQATLDAIAGEAHEAPRLLRELVQGVTPLLSLLNGLTLMYEEQAHRQRQAERAGLGAALAQLRAAAGEARRAALSAEIAATRGDADPAAMLQALRRLGRLSAQIDDLAAAAVGGAPR